MLALPVVGWLLAVVIGWHSWRERRPRLATGLGLSWILVAALCLTVNLGSYRRASDRALGLRADLAEPLGSEQALGLRLAVPGQPGVLRPELMTHEGVHVLSAGIFSALRAPYRDPALRLDLVPREAEAALAANAEDPRPAVVGLAFEEAEPRFVLIAPGGGTRGDATLRPASGARLEGREPLPFRIELPRTRLGELRALTFVWTEPGGGRLETRLEGEALDRSGDGERVTLEATLPAPLAFLRTLDAEVLFWWIELETREGTRSHLPWEVVLLPR